MFWSKSVLYAFTFGPQYYKLYSSLRFNMLYSFQANMPKEIAEYLNKMGARIPNIKPGKATVEYLGKIQASTRFWGISLFTIFSVQNYLLH